MIRTELLFLFVKNRVNSRGRVLLRPNSEARYYGLKVEITYAGEIGVEKHRLVFSPDVTGWHLAYDFFGNLLSIRSGNQTLQEQTYDAVTGKLEQTTWHNAEADHQVSYVYDLFDRLVEEKYNGVVKYRYEYNGEGDLILGRENPGWRLFRIRRYHHVLL